MIITKAMLNINAVDDELTPRSPVDSKARIVVGSGEHHRFGNNTDEVCVPQPIATREIPFHECRCQPQFIDFTGAKFDKLMVIGLAEVANNGGRNRINPNWKDKTNFSHKNPQGTLRWVVRCVCGNYGLRSSKAIKSRLAQVFGFDDACYQCRQLDKLRNGCKGAISGKAHK
jgi:hypothetical protein